MTTSKNKVRGMYYKILNNVRAPGENGVLIWCSYLNNYRDGNSSEFESLTAAFKKVRCHTIFLSQGCDIKFVMLPIYLECALNHFSYINELVSALRHRRIGLRILIHGELRRVGGCSMAMKILNYIRLGSGVGIFILNKDLVCVQSNWSDFVEGVFYSIQNEEEFLECQDSLNVCQLAGIMTVVSAPPKVHCRLIDELTICWKVITPPGESGCLQSLMACLLSVSDQRDPDAFVP